jgi:uncharacterized protein YggE
MSPKKLSALVVATALLAAGLVGAAMMMPTGAQNTDETADRTITVDATGEADAAPNQAVLRIAVTAEGDDPQTVRDGLSAGAADLRENLAEANVSEEQYETSEYRIRQDRRPPREEQSSDAPEYRGAHQFEVTLDDPDRVGAVLDAAADAGAEVNHVSFTLSDERREELRSDAIADAMSDARLQADTIANNGDLSVTSVANVDASEQRYAPVRYEAAAAGAAADGTSVSPGDVTVSYNVRVTYNATTN